MSDEQLSSEQGDSPRIVADPSVHEPYGLADASALPFRVVAWNESETSDSVRPWIVFAADGRVVDWCETREAAEIVRGRRQRDDPDGTYRVTCTRLESRS